MDTLSDEQILDAYVASANIRYFDELVRRHIGKVRSMIYPMVLNDADADELTQEVFLRVVKSLSGFGRRSQFSTWLHRIAVNTANSFLKRSVGRRTDNCAELPESADPAAGPGERLMSSETGNRIERALDSLSPPLRTAITLTAIHGMGVKEAANTAGCLSATMYWRVHEARRILKLKLGTTL